jgi:hypothetical protein
MFYLGLRAYQARTAHQERMMALDRGVDIKPILLSATPAFGHRIYLLRGLLWLFVGAALAGTLAVTSPLFRTAERGPQEKLEFKLLRARSLKDLGATAEQIDAMEKQIEQAERRHEPPANLVIIGLIPMSAGLAYLIFFGIEELRLRRIPPA